MKLEDELKKLEEENRLLRHKLQKKQPESEPENEESGQRTFFPFGTVPRVKIQRD